MQSSVTLGGEQQIPSLHPVRQPSRTKSLSILSRSHDSRTELASFPDAQFDKVLPSPNALDSRVDVSVSFNRKSPAIDRSISAMASGLRCKNPQSTLRLIRNNRDGTTHRTVAVEGAPVASVNSPTKAPTEIEAICLPFLSMCW